MSSAGLFVRLMSASVAVADHAGKIVRDILKKGNLGIVEKGGINDLQTEADRSAQRSIVDSLSKAFPQVTIIGEETLEEIDNKDHIVNLKDCEIINANCPESLVSVKEDEVVIWVDPLDGTAEYTQGLLDHVTVLIGLAVNGKAVGGVIHQPYYNYQNEKDHTKLGRTIWGIAGVGTHGIQQQMPPENKRIITTTRSHSNPTTNNVLAALKPDEVLRVGGAGHKVLLLIEGKAHAYIFATPGTKKWDVCAPEVILCALGGKLTDMHGEPIKYHAEVEHVNTGGILATYLASAHDYYCSTIPKELTSSLISNI